MKFDIKNSLKKALGEPWGDFGRGSAIQRAQPRHVTCGRSINTTSRRFLIDTLRIRNVVAVDSRMALNGPMTPRTIRRRGLIPLLAIPSALNAV